MFTFRRNVFAQLMEQAGRPDLAEKSVLDAVEAHVEQFGDNYVAAAHSIGLEPTEAYPWIRDTEAKDPPRSKRPLYTIWSGMKYRCYNPKCSQHDDYAGRGITVCDEWRDNYDAFESWAFENGYQRGLSIDRRNNDKGYSPENCRWATRPEQQDNRRNTIWAEINGEVHTLNEWAEITGLNKKLIRTRYSQEGKRGEALIAPAHAGSATPAKLITIGDDTHTITEWAEITGLRRGLIRERVKNGYVGAAVIAPVGGIGIALQKGNIPDYLKPYINE